MLGERDICPCHSETSSVPDDDPLGIDWDTIRSVGVYQQIPRKRMMYRSPDEMPTVDVLQCVLNAGAKG